jgi:hypothetical protein
MKHSASRGSRSLAGVEASIKYLLLSAFSSGVLLFWFSALYLQTGLTTLSWGPLTSTLLTVIIIHLWSNSPNAYFNRFNVLNWVEPRYIYGWWIFIVV